jgi:hypothetical protein
VRSSRHAAWLACACGALVSSSVGAQEDTGDGWRVEQFASRVTLFAQEGRGIQSQSEPDEQLRGDERTLIFQPTLHSLIRSDRNVRHDVTIPVDIVSAASPDALDAVTTASRDNEAVTLDIVSSIRTDRGWYVPIHWGGHIEENYWSGIFGFGVLVPMADDNATFRASVDTIFDTFDPISPTGFDAGLAHRLTMSVNIGFSQILSPTTIVSGAYGLTNQYGRLETTHNSVPNFEGKRVGDLFPRTRMRHAFSVDLRQAVPDSRTFFEGNYRFYVDDFGILAHTLQLGATQYIGDIWLRGHYRFHTQSAPYFWTEVTSLGQNDRAPRTADSDLEALDAHEVGGTLRLFFDRLGALTAESSYVQFGYAHYWRTNGLSVHVGSLEWGQTF